MKVDCWLCQPAGTPIFVQPGRRLGVTCVAVEADVLRPIHICVERRIARFTHIQTAFNTLTVVFCSTHATRVARVALRHFDDFDTLDFRLVGEHLREAIERPPVKIEVAVFPPVLRLAIHVLADAFQVPDVDPSNAFLDTSVDDVLGETVEEVGATLRPLVMKPGSPVATAVIACGDFLREVVAILLQVVARIQVGVLGTVCDSGEVADTEVNTSRFVTGGSGCLNVMFADEVEFPSPRRLVVDGANLLQVLDGDPGACFVFDEDVLPCLRVFFVIRALREANPVVLGVVFDAVLFPRYRRTGVFFVDAVALVVVVVFLAVAGRIRTVVGLSLSVPRVEGFSEFLQNALCSKIEDFWHHVRLRLSNELDCECNPLYVW